MVMISAISLIRAFGQSVHESEVRRFSESLVKRFESLPDKEAFDFWKQHGDPVQASIGMVNSAIENERTDFLKMLFGQRYGDSYLIEAVKEMPSSEKRHDLVIMMLRWPSSFWAVEDRDTIHNGSTPGAPDNVIEPFVGTIESLLPTLSINQDLFSTKENRVKLANQLEVAKSHPPSPHAERPAKRPPAKAIPLTSGPNGNSGMKGANAKVYSSSPESENPRSFHSIWVAVIVTFGCLSWWLFRKASGK